MVWRAGGGVKTAKLGGYAAPVRSASRGALDAVDDDFCLFATVGRLAAHQAGVLVEMASLEHIGHQRHQVRRQLGEAGARHRLGQPGQGLAQALGHHAVGQGLHRHAARFHIVLAAREIGDVQAAALEVVTHAVKHRPAGWG